MNHYVLRSTVILEHNFRKTIEGRNLCKRQMYREYLRLPLPSLYLPLPQGKGDTEGELLWNLHFTHCWDPIVNLLSAPHIVFSFKILKTELTAWTEIR